MEKKITLESLDCFIMIAILRWQLRKIIIMLSTQNVHPARNGL